MSLASIALAAVLSFGCDLGDLADTGSRDAASRGSAATESHRVPNRAVEVYQHVLRTGRAPDGHVGGRVFENREQRLPAGGRYQEFDVNPKVNGRRRGAERVVVDLDTGAGWYTTDHYRSFITIERSP
jgi:guanyl-specific ribonuclease Sa